MQPSIFNVRVPLADRDDVFLMNTFTDAQLIVSREVSDLLDRLGRDGFTPDVATSAKRFTTLAENGFIVESRDADQQNIENFFNEFRDRTGSAARDGADDAAVQLRVRLLHPGRSRRVQQDRGEDVDGHRGATSPSGPKRGLTPSAPKSFALTFFGGEPLLNLPVVYYLAERLSKACQARGVSMVINIITNGLLLTPELVDRLTPCGPLRRQGHARRRSRHAQPHAAAARRPGHVRQDSQQRPRRSRIAAGSRSAATSTNPRSTAIRRCSTSCASRTSPTSWRRSRSSRSSAKRSRSSRKASFR